MRFRERQFANHASAPLSDLAKSENPHFAVRSNEPRYIPEIGILSGPTRRSRDNWTGKRMNRKLDK